LQALAVGGWRLQALAGGCRRQVVANSGQGWRLQAAGGGEQWQSALVQRAA